MILFRVINFGASGVRCFADDEVAQAQRTMLDNVALEFVKMAFGAQPETAYGMLSREAKASISAEQLGNYLRSLAQTSGGFSNPRVLHTYLVDSVGSGPETRAICGLLRTTDWVAVAASPGIPQAHIVVTTHTLNNDWAFTIRLSPEASGWRVRSFHAGVSAIVGHSPEDLLELARQQRDSGHILNARVLYAGVQGIIERGSDFQLGIVPLVQNEIQQFTPPPEFQGRPPFTWKMNDNEYRVGQVSILGIEGKLALVFALPEDNWNGNDDANRRNHAFIDAFVSTHPDYSLVFNFLIARAYKPDGSGGFATVYESNRGYH